MSPDRYKLKVYPVTVYFELGRYLWRTTTKIHSWVLIPPCGHEECGTNFIHYLN